MAGVFRVFARLGHAEGMSVHISVLDPVQTRCDVDKSFGCTICSINTVLAI